VLPAIDLAPLRATPALTALILNANAIAAIDLSALAATPALERLWLHNNALTAIDLAPLALCPNLRSLYLDANRIDQETVDLSPLAACKLLRALRLGKNALGGQLDITPVLGCASLSTLDVSASVKLSARLAPRSNNPVTQVAAPGTLPPALRRRAATVHWIADDEDDDDEEDEEESSEEQDNPVNEENALVSPSSLLSMERSGGDTTSHAHVGLPRSASLEELATLCSEARRVPGTHAALLVGFRGATRFATEALLTEHGGLVTAVVSSPEACCAEAMSGAGALSACCVVLVHPDAEALIVDLRARDATMPIVVVGNAADAAEQASRCLRKGASCFFTEPLDARDALALRSMAHQRFRSNAYLRRRSPSPPARKKDHDPSMNPQGLVHSPSCSSLSSLCSSSGSSPWRPLAPGSPGFSLCPPMSSLTMGLPEPSLSSFVETDERSTCHVEDITRKSREDTRTARTPGSPLRKDRAPVEVVLAQPKSSPCSPPPRAPKRSPSRRIGSQPRLRYAIDFACLRSRVDGITTSRTNRVEDSAIGMLFSRCGGRAFLSDFGSVATLCGLPVCAGGALHAAAKRWTELSSSQKPVTPSLSPVSIMEFGGPVESTNYPSARTHREKGRCNERVTNFEVTSDCGSSGLSSGSLSRARSISAMKEILDQPEVERRQTEGLSYQMFRDFWTQNLCNRDCETRLFNVLRVAHRSECAVPVVAIRDLAGALVSPRGSDLAYGQMRNLAASLLCYELKGLSWQWIGRHEVRQARLCGSLLAAESGMFNGVAANLRADRMSDVQMAFAAASGRRIGGCATLSVKDIIWLNAERGLLTPRAVEAIFEREVGAGGMDLARFAPMWLAATNPDTRSSCEYLFGILDADSDGYINAMDAAHFYMEKRRLLLRDGYIPTAFEHVWRGLLDSVANGKVKSPTGRLQVSLTDLRSIGPRDWTILFQSLLFTDDDMAMVDLVKTSQSGSAAASTAVATLS
jgi:hypothetical protein